MNDDENLNESIDEIVEFIDKIIKDMMETDEDRFLSILNNSLTSDDEKRLELLKFSNEIQRRKLCLDKQTIEQMIYPFDCNENYKVKEEEKKIELKLPPLAPKPKVRSDLNEYIETTLKDPKVQEDLANKFIKECKV